MEPKTLAATFSRLPEPLRQQLEASLGRTTAAMAKGEGGDDILKLMQKQSAPGRSGWQEARSAFARESLARRPYLLAGTVEPGPELRSQAVLGGVDWATIPKGSRATAPPGTSAPRKCVS